jgi:hypothetical protein
VLVTPQPLLPRTGPNHRIGERRGRESIAYRSGRGGRPSRSPHFDRWYNDEHLRNALATFQADRAWRSWSKTDPTSHYAFYEFSEIEAAHAALRSEATKLLIAKFDQTWGERVIRTRDIVEVVQRLPKSN